MGLVPHHRDDLALEGVEIAQIRDRRRRKDRGGKRQVGIGEAVRLPPIRRRHHGRQQVDHSLLELPQGLAPRQALGDLEAHAEHYFHIFQIGNRYSLRYTGLVDELHRRPVGIDADPQDRVFA